MEDIEKFHPLLSKCNDAIVVERSVQNILEASLFSTSEVADACRTSVVTPYLLTAKKNLLALSTYPDFTDGILYCLPLLFDVGEELVLYVRYVLLIVFYFVFFYLDETDLCVIAILDLYLNLVSLLFF